jgi:hypothetical protein
MSHTLRSLDAEWRRMTRTSRAGRALRQWSIAHPALRGLADLDELLERRRDDQAAPSIRRALAVLAPGDGLAARALLPALLPGLVRLAGMIGYDDPAAIEEIVSLAWELRADEPHGQPAPLVDGLGVGGGDHADGDMVSTRVLLLADAGRDGLDVARRHHGVD